MTKKAPTQKSTREEPQHVLDWKTDQAVCVTPKYTLLRTKSKDVCLTNIVCAKEVMWKRSMIQQVLLCFQWNNFTHRKTLSWRKQRFVSPLPFHIWVKKFLKTHISSRHFHFSNFFTWKIVYLQILPWQPSHLYKNMSLTQYIQVIITYFNIWQYQWPTANALENRRKTNPTGKCELLLFIRTAYIHSFHLFLNLWIFFWTNYVPFLKAKLSPFIPSDIHAKHSICELCNV